MLELQNNKHSIKKYLSWYFSIAFLGALGELIYLLTIPSDPKNSILFGYSASRLVLIAFFLSSIAGAFVFALRTWRDQGWVQKLDALLFADNKISNWGLVLSGTVFLVTGLVSLVPISRFGQFAAYAERLQPVIFYFVQISFQTIILILQRTGRLHWNSLTRELRANSLMFWIAAGCMTIFGALWIVVSRTGIGIRPTPQTNWYETGVPVLAIQVGISGLIAALVAALIAWISRRVKNLPLNSLRMKLKGWGGSKSRGTVLDIFLGITIWVLAAFLWTQAPMAPNFFAPGPYPPDYVYLPYSDAASFDMSAQYALIGKGIANGSVFKGHNAYHGFLAFLHLLAGQDYSLLVTLQVIIFAILPVIVFFIGKGMQSRFFGIFMAGIVIFQELNAIASGNRLNLSHSKLLLTEFPTKIGLALLILLLFLWLRKPGKKFAYAFPLGGVLGILIMLRYNTLVMPFCVIAGFILVFGKGWQNWLKASVIMILALGITISPWMWRSWKISGNPLFFAPKLVYRLKLEFQDSHEPLPPADPVPDIELESGSLFLIQHSTSTLSKFVGFSPPQTKAAKSIFPSQQGSQAIMGFDKDGKSYLIGSNFVHNLITNFLILPTRPLFDFLPDSIVDGSLYETAPFWKDLYMGWLEDMPLVDLIGVVINLLFLSLGVGAAYRQWKWAGLIPLGVLLAYHLSTALVRDSGGRYIVPVDWIMLLYFALGLLQITLWGLVWLGLMRPPLPNPLVSFRQSFGEADSPQSWGAKGAAFLLTLPFFLYALSMTVLDQTMPQKYIYFSESEVLERLNEAEMQDQTHFDAANLEEFLDHPDARSVFGVNLYPRFFLRNQGLHRGIYLDRPFPRLAFRIITATGPENVLLPLTESPLPFLHGSDVIVIGCQNVDRRGLWYIDALLVVIFDIPGHPTLYTRNPAFPFPLSCPLQN